MDAWEVMGARNDQDFTKRRRLMGPYLAHQKQMAEDVAEGLRRTGEYRWVEVVQIKEGEREQNVK